MFGNDRAMVARLLSEFLLGEGPFARTFTHVSFALLYGRGGAIGPFMDVFQSAAR